jgi:hypothetical protein
MNRKFDSKKINSSHLHTGSSRLTNYLRLDSCRLLLGSLRPEVKTRNRRRILTLIALIIFAIGFFYVVF